MFLVDAKEGSGLMKSDDEEDLIFDHTSLLSKDVRLKDFSLQCCPSGGKLQIARTVNLCLSFFGLGLCFAIPTATLNDLQKAVRADDNIKNIYTARYSGYLFGALIGGFLFDRYNRQFLLFLSLLATGIGILIMPFCHELAALMACTAVTGITMGFLDTGGNVWCLDLWGRRSAPFMQALHFCFGLGAFVAPLVAEPFLSPHPQATQFSSNGSFASINTSFLHHRPYLGFSHLQPASLKHNVPKRSAYYDDDFFFVQNFPMVKRDIDNVLEFENVSLANETYNKNESSLVASAAIVPSNTNNFLSRFMNGSVTNSTTSPSIKSTIKPINTSSTPGAALVKKKPEYADGNAFKVASVWDRPGKDKYGKVKELDSPKAPEPTAVTLSTTAVPPNNTMTTADASSSSSKPEFNQTELASHESTNLTLSDSNITLELNNTEVTESLNGLNKSTMPNLLSTTPSPTEIISLNSLDNITENSTINITLASFSQDNKSLNNVTAKEISTLSPPVINATEVSLAEQKRVILKGTLLSNKSSEKNHDTLINNLMQTDKLILNSTEKLPTSTEAHVTEAVFLYNSKNESKALLKGSILPVSKSIEIKPNITLQSTKDKNSSSLLLTPGLNVMKYEAPDDEPGDLGSDDMLEQSYVTDELPPSISTLKSNGSNGLKNRPENNLTLKVPVQEPKADPIVKPQLNKLEVSSTAPDENTTLETPAKSNDLFTELFNLLHKNRLGKFEIPYVILAMYIFVVAIVFLVFLCKNPREPRSRQVEDLNRSRDVSLSFRVIMVGLMSLFLCLYVGMEVGVGQLLETFATKEDLRLSQARGYFLPYLFWGSFAAARGISIFIASHFSGRCMLLTNLSICLTASILLVAGADKLEALLWIGVVVLGAGMAPLFPTSISWLEHYLHVTNKTASIFVLGAAIGELIIPIIIGTFINQEPMVLMYVNIIVNALCFVSFVILCGMASKHNEKYQSKPKRSMYQLTNSDDFEDGTELVTSVEQQSTNGYHHLPTKRKNHLRT